MIIKMFFDIITLIKKTTLYRERYVQPGPLSDTENLEYLKIRRKE